jgi:hypothetical protein
MNRSERKDVTIYSSGNESANSGCYLFYFRSFGLEAIVLNLLLTRYLSSSGPLYSSLLVDQQIIPNFDLNNRFLTRYVEPYPGGNSL